MESNIKNVNAQSSSNPSAHKEEVKHFTLRLPSSPDFSGNENESTALTKLRAMKELLNGERYTIHALLCDVVENAVLHDHALPFPKSFAIPTRASVERIDLRLTQKQIDIVDALRDRLKPQLGIIDFREYYNRPDVVRELLTLEFKRVETLFQLKYSPSDEH